FPFAACRSVGVYGGAFVPPPPGVVRSIVAPAGKKFPDGERGFITPVLQDDSAGDNGDTHALFGKFEISTMKRLRFRTIIGLLLPRPSVLTLSIGFSTILLLHGCATPSATPAAALAGAPASANAARDAAGGDYQIGPEDLLEIAVWREKDLQREVLVRPDGWLTFPLVGNVQAAGKTPLQLQTEITARLKKYIPDPVVTVTVKKIQGLKV